MTRRIGFIGFDKIVTLDLTGPLEVFATANHVAATKAYQPLVVSESGKIFHSEIGVGMCANYSFRDAPAFDTIVVPGGAGLRDPKIASAVVSFLQARAPTTRRMASVCTGLEALAQAKLMDGRRATTHWRFADAFASKYPEIKIDANAIHMRDGKFYTSAGVTAGIDLAMTLVAADLGEKIALKVARELVVHLKRSGGQEQFSEPLQFQLSAKAGFSELTGWILRNLHKDLKIEILAARANLGVRHFSRRFKSEVGVPPADYVERLRLDEARRRLQARGHSIDRIAKSVGYASADAFRRAFERRFGVLPSEYEQRFPA